MKSVLIIDDEQTDANLLSYLIAKRSPIQTEVTIVDTIEEAVSVLHKADANFLFLNLELPGAVELLMNAKQRSIPTVATISQLPESILAVRFLGVDYLFRPFVPEQVSEYLCADKWSASLSKILT